MSIFVGIDIGLKGGIVAIDGESEKLLYCVPIPPSEKRDHIFNSLSGKHLELLSDHLNEIQNLSEGRDVNVYAEKLHALFGSSAKATFNFGFINGWTLGVFEKELGGIELVRAVDWQKYLFSKYLTEPIMKTVKGKEKKDTKAMSIHVATLFEEGDYFIPSKRSRVISDGMTDAYCIARYAMEVCNED